MVKRHGKRIGRKCQGKQQGTKFVETGAIGPRPAAISRQGALRENKSQDAQGQVDEENSPPTGSGDQHATERGSERRAERGHGAEQTHGAAGLCLGHRLADKGHRQGHHDGRSEALHRPCANQQPERGRKAAQDRGRGEQADPGQQQAAAADDVT